MTAPSDDAASKKAQSDKPRRKNVTLTQIAQHLGLSVATVSYVLNGKVEENKIPERTAERVRKAAAELGYVPNEMARSLRRQRSGVIGILFSDLLSSWAHRCVVGMLRVFDEGRFIPYISVHFWDPEREQRELQSMLGRRVEAIITVPMAENARYYKLAEERGVPVVFLQDSIAECPEISYAMWDARAAARASVLHLAESGRTKIGFVAVDQQTPFMLERLAGYREGMQEAGLEVNEDWMLFDPFVPVYGAFREKLVYGSAVRALFESDAPKPEALLAMNDSVGMTTLGTLKFEMGIHVPETVAIMGMGNLPESQWLELSSSVEPIEDVGEAAARAVKALLAGKEARPLKALTPGAEILARGSTAAINTGVV